MAPRDEPLDVSLSRTGHPEIRPAGRATRLEELGRNESMWQNRDSFKELLRELHKQTGKSDKDIRGMIFQKVQGLYPDLSEEDQVARSKPLYEELKAQKLRISHEAKPLITKGVREGLLTTPRELRKQTGQAKELTVEKQARRAMLEEIPPEHHAAWLLGRHEMTPEQTERLGQYKALMAGEGGAPPKTPQFRPEFAPKGAIWPEQSEWGLLNVLTIPDRATQGLKYGEIEELKKQFGRTPISMAELQGIEGKISERDTRLKGIPEVLRQQAEPLDLQIRQGGVSKEAIQADPWKEHIGVGGASLKHAARSAFSEGLGGPTQAKIAYAGLKKFYKQNAFALAQERLPEGSEEAQVEEAKRILPMLIKADTFEKGIESPMAAQLAYEFGGSLATGSLITKPAVAAAKTGYATLKKSEALAPAIEGMEQWLAKGVSRDPHLRNLSKQGELGQALSDGARRARDVGMVTQEQSGAVAQAMDKVLKRIPKGEEALFHKVMTGEANPSRLSKRARKAFVDAQDIRDDWWNFSEATRQRTDVRRGRVLKVGEEGVEQVGKTGPRYVKARQVKDYSPRKVLEEQQPKLDSAAQRYGFDDAEHLGKVASGQSSKLGQGNLSAVPEELRQVAAGFYKGDLQITKAGRWAPRGIGRTGSEKARTGVELDWKPDERVQWEAMFKKDAPGVARAAEIKELDAVVKANKVFHEAAPIKTVVKGGKRIFKSSVLHKRAQKKVKKLTRSNTTLQGKLEQNAAKISQLGDELEALPGMRPGVRQAILAEARRADKLESAAKVYKQAKDKLEQVELGWVNLKETQKKTWTPERIASLRNKVQRFEKAVGGEDALALKAQMRGKEVLYVQKTRPGLLKNLRAATAETRRLEQQLTKNVKNLSAHERSLPGLKKALEADRVQYQKLVETPERLAKEWGVEVAPMSQRLSSEWARQTKQLGTPAKTTVKFAPREVVEQGELLFPEVSMAPKAQSKIKDFVRFMHDYVNLPYQSAWRTAQTFLAGGERYQMMNMLGNFGNNTVAQGIRAFNPKTNFQAARGALAAAMKKDPEALKQVAAVMEDGTQVTLGQVLEELGKGGMLKQGQLRFGREMGTGKGPLGLIAKGASKLAWLPQEVASLNDDMMKVSNFIGAIQKGGKWNLNGINRAYQEASELAGNFRRLSPFEKNFVKQVVPFYAWNRYIWPMWTKKMVESPHRALAWQKLTRMAENAWGEEHPVGPESVSPFLQRSGFTAPPWAQLPKDPEERARLGIPKDAFLMAAPETPMAPMRDTSQEGFMFQVGPMGYAVAVAALGYDPITRKPLPSALAMGDAIEEIMDAEGVYQNVTAARRALKRTHIGRSLYGMVGAPSEQVFNIFDLYWNNGEKGKAVDWMTRVAVGRFAGMTEYAVIKAMQAMGVDITPQSLGLPLLTEYGVDPSIQTLVHQKEGKEATQQLEKLVNPASRY